MSGVEEERSFFDTNILVYADDPRDPTKNRRAIQLIQQHLRAATGVVSTQVLSEYFVTLTHKSKGGLGAREARRKVELLSTFDVISTRLEDIFAAIDLSQKHRISYWDALVVRAAIQGGCRLLVTEDLQHGQLIEGVQIVNPFL